MADKASIVFGAFNIGVRLTLVMKASNGTPALKTLHAECKTPINEQKFCPSCEKVISKDEIAKGYVQSKNHIIPLTPEEVESAKTPRSSVVELAKFVEPLEPFWIERTYWVAPEPLSERAYFLLDFALRETKLWGIGSGAIWGKERPYAIQGDERGLSLHILHTIEEFTGTGPVVSPNVSAAELEMGVKLVESWAAPLEEEDLTVLGDSLLRTLITAKAEGKEFVPPKEVIEPAPSPDILAAMKETIAMKKKSRSKAKA